MEIWKDIYFIYNGVEYDYRGLYQISNLGNVKSLYYQGIKREKILKYCEDGNGYLFVNLWKNKKSKHFLIHRLVSYVFLSESYFDGAEVNHKDENHKNNCVENLEWCTKEYNNNYGTKIKRGIETRKENGTLYKSDKNCLSKKVYQYNKQNNLIKVWNCINDINRELGINGSDIVKCCKFWEINCNKEEWFRTHKHSPIKTAGGFIWKYVDDTNFGNY